MKKMKWTLLAMLSVVLATSCSDKDIISSGSVLGPEETEQVVVEPMCEDNTYSLETNQAWTAEIEDTWAVLYEESGIGATQLKFYTEENTEDEGRQTNLKITFADATTKTVIIRQKGLAEVDANELSSGTYKKFGVGYGYNGYGKYADATYITSQIFNEEGIRNWLGAGEAGISTEPYDLITSVETTGSSSEDLSSDLSVKAGLNIDLKCGFSLDIQGNYSQEDLSNSSKNFANMRYKKIVLRKTAEIANVVELARDLAENIDEGKNKEILSQILTTGFRRKIERLKAKIESSSVTNLDDDLKDFVDFFGTHTVVAADLGGCFDYSMTTDKSNVSSQTDISGSLSIGYNKMFSITGNGKDSITSKKLGSNYTCKVSVKGGNAGILSAASNGQEGGNNMEDIKSWGESINENNALMIDHTLMPIWKAIPYENVAKAVEEYLTTGTYLKVMSKVYQLPEAVSDVTGAVKVSLKDFREEVETGNYSLIYTVNAAGAAFAEICHELIPALGNNRVFVAYPIIENKPDYSKGFFLGNGARKPGTVEWNETKNTYIYTADGNYADTDIIDTLYICGNNEEMTFSNFKNSDKNIKSWGTAYMQPSTVRFYKYIDGQNVLSKYNIVKIGHQVWMRENISGTRGVGYENLSYFIKSGTTDFYYKDGNNLLQTQWSLPNADSFKQLQTIAQTGAPFLKGGSSGFDLEVTGYSKGEMLVFDDNYIFLLTSNGTAICIDKDGLQPMFEPVTEKSCYYPVRLIRSDDFKYE